MAKKNAKTYLPPPFYIILILGSVLGLGYMMLAGIAPHDSLALISVSQIYGFLFLSSLAFVAYFLWRHKVTESLTTSSLWLVAGMVVWTSFLALQDKMLNMSLTFPVQTIFSTIVGEIPPFYNFIMVNLWSPVIEELFFGIGIPVAVFMLFRSMSKSFPILGNSVIQILAVIFISMTTFAYFHTSATMAAFFVAAMMFRTIMIVMLHGDRLFDIIPKLTVSFAFIVGAHIANNVYVFGFSDAYQLLISEPYGWVALFIFGLFGVMAARGLVTGGK